MRKRERKGYRGRESGREIDGERVIERGREREMEGKRD